MTTPARILWDLAGQPDPPKGMAQAGADRPCAICGLKHDAVVTAADAIPSTDTDRALYAAIGSEVVCVPCVWSGAGKPPDTLRMWSILYREDGGLPDHHSAIYDARAKMAGKGKLLSWDGLIDGARGKVCMTNKGNPSPLVELLLDPPAGAWFASVADSGQIHTIRFAQVNYGRGGLVRFERQNVGMTPDLAALLLYHVASLSCEGFGADDILTGQPNPNTLYRTGLEVWRHHATPLKPYFHSDTLRLLLWACTKATTDDHRLRAEAALCRDGQNHAPRVGRRPDDGGAGLDPPRQEKPQDVLEPSAEGAGGRGEAVEQPPTVHSGAGAHPPTGGVAQSTRQLSLFGD